MLSRLPSSGHCSGLKYPVRYCSFPFTSHPPSSFSSLLTNSNSLILPPFSSSFLLPERWLTPSWASWLP
ncbi:hypothetical protein LINGRAHAP2_LOCUS18316 [Linum grandiflorum]